MKIDIPTVLVDLRSQVVDAHRGTAAPKPEAVAMKGVAATFASSKRLGLAERFTRLGTGAGCAAALSPPSGRGARDLPSGPVESFRAWWKRTGRGTRWLSAMDDAARRSSPGSGPPRPLRHRPSTTPRRTPPRPGSVDLFVERVADYRAVVERCEAAELAARVVAAVEGCSVVVPEGLGVEVPGAVVDAGLSSTELDAIDAVVTEATVGIAETGTIVLSHGTGRAAARSRSSPTGTSASCARTRSSPTSSDAVSAARPRPPR